MAATLVKHHKMKRSESKKPHSWRWDSHVSPKNNRWLDENLEDMDQKAKRILKLNEEDAGSSSKIAEIVEDFHHNYSRLVQRYDHLTEELKKRIPTKGVESSSDSKSESDDSSESSYAGVQNIGLRLTEELKKRIPTTGVESSSDSKSESDDSSESSYAGVQKIDEDQVLRKRIIQLEVELLDMKEKFQMLQKEISEGSKSGDSEVILTKIAGYEEELKVRSEKIKLSEEEISKLNVEIQKYKSTELSSKLESDIDIIEEPSKVEKTSLELQRGKMVKFPEQTGDSESIMEFESKISALAEELQITKGKLLDSEKEVKHLRLEVKSDESCVRHLQELVRTLQKDDSVWKAKFEEEKEEVSKLQNQTQRYKSNLSERVQQMRKLREKFSYENKMLSKENDGLQAEITQLKEDKMHLEDKIREADLPCPSLGEDVRRIKAGKAEMEAASLGDEIEKLKAAIVEKNNNIEQLNTSLQELKLRYDTLISKGARSRKRGKGLRSRTIELINKLRGNKGKYFWKELKRREQL